MFDGSLPLAGTAGGSSVNLLFHDVYAGDPDESGFRSAAANRYKLSLSQFDRHLAGLSSAADGLAFSLTFDDGGASFYTNVADRLEERGWRAHCFVPTALIDRPGFLTRSQVRELDRRGHHIGSHSATHPLRMSACDSTSLRREWTESVRALEDLLGRGVRTASVPGGYYSTAVATAAERAGIRVLFTSQPITRSRMVGACAVVGRFAIRAHDSTDLSARLVAPSPWARRQLWADWNAKALIKPLLGPAYRHVADWLMARTHARVTTR
jgi:peptidoglycan/xylan/chitin deacetylase (PgdA/CDA1 family)